jgi:hypothetical protein
MNNMTLNTHKFSISLNEENLSTLLKSNISCHFNKPLSHELIDEITKQIVESIDFFINKRD